MSGVFLGVNGVFSGLWDQGLYPHFCDTRESPPMYGGFVFGNSFHFHSVVSQKWSFPTALLILQAQKQATLLQSNYSSVSISIFSWVL